MMKKPAGLVLLAALAHLTIELCSNFLPVVYPIFIETLGLRYTQIGMIALVAVTATSLPQLVFGYLSDRWDPGRLAVISVLWIGCLMGLVGFAWNFSSLLLIVGLGMLGSALFHPCGAAIASAGSGARRGSAMSIFSVGGNLGYALSPLVLTASITRWGLNGTAILIPVTIALGWALYSQWQPEAYVPLRRAGEVAGRHQNGFLVGLILIVIMSMTRSWFQSSFTTYLPLWVEAQGQSVVWGSELLFWFSMASGLGSLTGGGLSDRVGRWQVLGVSMALIGPALWLFLQGSGEFQRISVGLMGFFLGTTFPVAVVLAQETWPQGIGLAGGLVMGLGWMPGGVGSAVTGVIADRFSLSAGLQALIVAPMIGASAMLLYAWLSRLQSRHEGKVVQWRTRREKE